MAWGLVLGGSWEGLGRGLGPHGLSWAVFWSFFLLIWDPRVSKRAQELPKRSLELDLGVVWEGLGKVFWRFLTEFWTGVERFGNIYVFGFLFVIF